MYCPLSSHTLSCTFCLLIVGGVCNFLSSVLSQQKFEATGQTSITALGQTSVTAQFYLQSKGKYILEAWGHANPKDMKRIEAPAHFWVLFLYVFFSSPGGLPYVNWARQEYCLFYLRSSLQSSDLPLFYFHRLFPSLSFSHHHSGLLFPILTT